MKAHRAAWISVNGPLSGGRNTLVLHRCNNKRCVNISHLYIGSDHDNVMDSIRDGKHPSVAVARKTHCVHGHPLSGDNLHLYPSKSPKRRWRGMQRVCRECHRQNARRQRDAMKARKAACSVSS